MNTTRTLFTALLLLAAVLFATSLYTLSETEQAIITRFGEPVGGAVQEAGLHFKLPWPIHEVHRFDKRWLPWDGDANQIPTKDKKFIWVDTYARWRIQDPLQFFVSVTNEQQAQRLYILVQAAKEHECFIKTKQHWFVKVDFLCTEPKSSRYLLLLYDKCREVSERQVDSNSFHKIRQSNHEYSPEALAVLLLTAVKSEYDVRDIIQPDLIRCGLRTDNQLLYPKKLANETYQRIPANSHSDHSSG